MDDKKSDTTVKMLIKKLSEFDSLLEVWRMNDDGLIDPYSSAESIEVAFIKELDRKVVIV